MKRGMFWLILMVAILVSYTVVHEKIHSEISRYFGHDECTFGFNELGVYQSCPNRFNTSINIVEEMKLHSINEIVGYHFLFGVAIFLIGYIRKQGDNE